MPFSHGHNHLTSYFFLSASCPGCCLHSFPTRRSSDLEAGPGRSQRLAQGQLALARGAPGQQQVRRVDARSEEHTSELLSLTNLVCRLLLEKKKKDLLTNVLYI